MNTTSYYPTRWIASMVIALLAATALAGLYWQHCQLKRQRQQMVSLKAETCQLSGLRDEIARLKRLEADHTELARLRQAHLDGQLEVARLRAQATAAQRAQTEDGAPPTPHAPQLAEAPASTNLFTASMAEMMRNSMDQVFQRRMARLKDKLTLSPEQSQAIEKILAPQYRGAAEASAGLFAGKIDREKLAERREARGNGGHRDDQIRALLSPEQQTAYVAMKEEDAMNNARLAANGELIQMQNNLSLTTDQQDKVFAILYEQIHQQFKAESSGNTAANPAEALRARHQRQIQALENVLTPGQLRGYQEQQERKIQFMEKMVAQMKAGMGRE